MFILNLQFEIVVLTSLIVIGAILYDLKWRRIPNFITIPGMLMGVSLHSLYNGWAGFSASLGGLVLGGGIFAVFYLLGGMGAGDVKLMGCVSALLGFEKAVTAFILTAFVGGIIAVVYLVREFSWNTMLKYLGRGDRSLSSINHQEDETNTDPLKLSLPYGVAIGIGTLITLFYC